MRTIYCAGKLYDGKGKSVLNDHAICVSDGRIEDMGPKSEITSKYPEANTLHNEKWMITPAFIDSHDHGRAVSPVAFNVQDKCLEMWIPELCKVVSANPYTTALYDGLNLLTSGVGTVVHSHNAADWMKIEDELVETTRGYNDAGIKVVICPTYVDQNSLIYHEREEFVSSLPDSLKEEFAGMVCDRPFSLDKYFEIVDNLINRLKKEIDANMVDIQLHPAGGQWCSDEALLKIKDYALSHNMQIHIHLLETKYQKQYAAKKWGCSIIQHFNDIGFLGPWLTCAHMVWIDESDIELLSKTKTKVVTNPSSNIRLKSGISPLRKILDAKITCAIGLDGCAFDDDQDYVREMRVAGYNLAETGVNGSINPSEVIMMATANGADVTGGKLSSGVLAVGKSADFVCFNYDRLEYPYADSDIDPIALLIQRGTKSKVDAVYINGECVVDKQKTLRKDIDVIASELRAEIIDKKNSGSSQRTVSQQLLNAIHDFYAGWE